MAKKFFQIDVTIAENVLNNFVVARRSAILQFPVGRFTTYSYFTDIFRSTDYSIAYLNTHAEGKGKGGYNEDDGDHGQEECTTTRAFRVS